MSHLLINATPLNPGNVLRLVFGKDYLLANQNAVVFDLYGVNGLDTADNVQLTTRNSKTKEIKIDHLSGEVEGTLVTFQIDAELLGYAPSSHYEYQIDVLHGDDCKAVACGNHTLLEDASEGFRVTASPALIQQVAQLQSDLNDLMEQASFNGTLGPDFNPDGFIYIGGLESGNWTVKRSSADTGDQDIANAANNPSIDDLSTAFDQRTELVFE